MRHSNLDERNKPRESLGLGWLMLAALALAVIAGNAAAAEDEDAEIILPPPSVPCAKDGNCDEITSDALGLRGLPRRYHGNYVFGMTNLVFGSVTLCSSVGFAVGAGITAENDRQWRLEHPGMSDGSIGPVLMLLLGTLPLAIVTAVAGTVAAISAGIVEPNRERTVTVSERSSRRPRVHVAITPLGVYGRF